jgi:hypothetical protein
MTECELLRLHIEAVWNLTLPALDEGIYHILMGSMVSKKAEASCQEHFRSLAYHG